MDRIPRVHECSRSTGAFDSTEDWVIFMKQLVDEHNLSTHKPEAFYEYFEPVQARRLLDTLEFRFTPVHGSWLNTAEIEFNRLQQQCLDRRIPDAATLRQEVAAWTDSLIRGRQALDDRMPIEMI